MYNHSSMNRIICIRNVYGLGQTDKKMIIIIMYREECLFNLTHYVSMSKFIISIIGFLFPSQNFIRPDGNAINPMKTRFDECYKNLISK